MTRPLFTRQGELALRELSRRRAALVFDLDGTLAPIVRRPSDAQVPPATAARLRSLSGCWPIAVVTGRSVDDAAARLGFDPAGLYGNHGAQRRGALLRAGSMRFERALDAVRARLRAHAVELRSRGIEVEDKGLSLALHYRAAPDPEQAQACLRATLGPDTAGLRVEDGHCVVNLMAADAPDKGDAVREVLDGWGLDCALVVGDDGNDEPAFAAAPPGSVSVRVGATGPATAARFTLERQAQIDDLLDLLLCLRPATSRPT